MYILYIHQQSALSCTKNPFEPSALLSKISPSKSLSWNSRLEAFLLQRSPQPPALRWENKGMNEFCLEELNYLEDHPRTCK